MRFMMMVKTAERSGPPPKELMEAMGKLAEETTKAGEMIESGGLGPTVSSWIAEGPNAPVSAGEVHKAFGEETMNEMAAKAGISPQELAEKLATVLPHAVNALTPGGDVPGT